MHTLPPKLKTTDKIEPPDDVASNAGGSGTSDSDDTSEKLLNETVSSKKSGPQAKSPNSTANIPRLISVSEIIKREYFRKLPFDSTGLYQYNYLGYLEEDDTALSNLNTLDENDRAEYIAAVLEGKNL